jgi:simple sugar transport system permease protein
VFESLLNTAWEVGASTLRLAVPLVFAAIGGMFSERSGVVNIALEGKMVVGAFVAAVIAFYSGSPWAGFFAGGIAGALIGVIYALSVIEFRANQIVSGTGINLLALGIAPFVCKILFDVTGSTPTLDIAQRFSYEPLVVAALAVGGITYWFYRTVGGLRLQIAGEHPEALAAAGGNVILTRWLAVIMAGFMAGLGGACLSIFLSSSYSRNMTAGRGFIALAALILGKWRPVQTALACLLFGFTDAIQIRLQGVEISGIGKVPVQFIQILPYVATLILLTGVIGKSRAPKALGTLNGLR